MKQQKFILKSKTVWGALITLFLAVSPYLQDGIENGMTRNHWLQISSILLGTASTIVGRYKARGEIYTPHGLPGRDYISATHQASKTNSSYENPDYWKSED